MKSANSFQASSNCEHSFTAIKIRNFLNWSGIPTNCSYINFQNFFPATTDDFGVGFLGRKNDKAKYRMHVIEGYRLSSQIWFLENDLKQIILNFPILPYAASALKRCFDIPAMKLDYHLDIACITQGAWIYPDRGIVLFLDNRGVELMKVSLFHPCELDYYLDFIHFNVEMTELSAR